MKRMLLFMAMLAGALPVLAQAIQRCVVMQYNQERPKTPLGGVEVMVSNAGSQVSASDGTLTLSFRTLKPGDKVNLLSVRKAGFELMNTEAVEQWFIARSQTAFELVMVRSGELARLKERLTEASTASYRTKYEQAMQRLERLKKEGQLKEEEYNRRCDELESDYQIQLKNLGNYIDQFARIDLCEASAEELGIIDMVQKGDIDEAVNAYARLDISDKLRQARENRKTLTEARARIEEEESRHRQAIEALEAMQEREIATLKLAGGKDNYDKVARLLKENALADTTDIEKANEYAQFAYRQKDYEEAERFFLICMNGTADNPHVQSSYLNNLGVLNLELHNYAKAEEYYLMALENKTRLFESNPEAYRSELAGVQNNIGLLYGYINDRAKAEDYFLMALQNYSLLNAEEDDANRDDIAATQNNLGSLYFYTQDFKKAEQYFLKAWENRTLLFDHDPEAFRADLAISQNNLASLYKRYDFAKAEEFYRMAVENYSLLFAQNPDAYRSYLADTHYNVALLYAEHHDYDKALAAIGQAIALMPEEAEYNDTRGEILLMKGDEQGAPEH